MVLEAAYGRQADQDLTTDADPTFRDLLVTGNLLVQGTTTTIDTTTLLVEDKNIELGSVTTPTDVTADGGGITLKGAIDYTILWLNATNAWTFNQSIDLLTHNLFTSGAVSGGRILAANLQLEGNTLSATFGDIDVTTQTGGVSKFTDNAFRSGQDATNYLEIGHGGSNAFVNAVGAGGIDFRFGGTTKATFTPFGHLHLLTDVDQKHTLKIVTANNLNDTGLAWENSGGAFTHTIFRTDVGSNRADLVFAAGQDTNIDLLTDSFKIHGSAANEGRLEVLAALQISSGAPGVGKVLTSDAAGLATWTLPTGGGWTKAGTVIRLITSSDKVGIGTGAPNAKLDVRGSGGVSVGGFASGAMHVTSDSASVNANAVITGHNLFGGNKQLWYLGSVSSSSDSIAFINRQVGAMSFFTSNATRMTIEAGGDIGIGLSNPTEKLEVNGNIKATTIIDTSIFAQLNSSVDQIPTDTNPTVITYNTQDAIAGLTHSTTVNPGEITIDTAGIYFVSPQPQVGKDSGGVKVDFDLFWQIDRGSGFVDEANSNIKRAIKDADITDGIVSAFTIALNVGDKIRMMQKVSTAGVGMGLKNTDPVVGPPTIPRTPSIILTMYRVGG